MLCASVGCLLWVLALGLVGLAVSCSPVEPTPEVLDAVRDYSEELPVFPGADGFGTRTRAGRRGTVVRVTSLEGEGPGTLREALAVPERRVVIFEVGGVIDITKPLVIEEPYVTVAGQTAPSPGITIVGAGIVVHTHDVLIQHVRVRVGDRLDGPDPGGRDGIGIVGRPGGTVSVCNVVIDHCSISWAVDEGVSTWHPGVHDITIRQCIISENLSRSIHPQGEHSKGLLIGDHSKRVAVIGNLFAHNMKRNPFIKGDGSALIVNNLIYNPGKSAIHFDDRENSGPSLAAIIGNVLIPGPDTRWYMPMVNIVSDTQRSTRVYGMQNDTGGCPLYRSIFAWSVWNDLRNYDDCPVRVTPLRVRDVREVVDWVLDNAGARPAERDAVDERMIMDVMRNSGHIINSQNDVGGFPDVEPVRQPATCPPRIPKDPDADTDGNGYTNLEEWLQDLANEVEGYL